MTVRRRSVEVAGLVVDDLEPDHALRDAVQLLDRPGSAYIVTPNVDCAVLAEYDADLRRAVRKADLSIPDGRWLSVGSRLAGGRLKGHVPGRWLAEQIVRVVAARGGALFLLGSTDEVLASCAERLNARFAGITISYFAPPRVDVVTEAFVRDSVKAIRAAAPDVVLVALGMPKQELWMESAARLNAAPLMIGVGGTLELLAGLRLQPPRWVVGLGLEWLFRLVQEPRRLARRYLVRDPRFLGWAIRARVAGAAGWSTSGPLHR